MERESRSETIVFFDVDGVLIDGYCHNPIYRNMWDKNIEHDLGIKTDDLALYFKNIFPDVIIGREPLRETLSNHLTALGYTTPVDVVIEYWMTHDARINSYALNFIQKWRENPKTSLYLATNQEHIRADYLWNNLNFKSYFTGLFYSGSVGVTKSDPRFFHHVNQDLNITPDTQRILYFDDSPACIESAQKAGWKNTVLVTNPEFFKDYKLQAA